MLLTGRSVHLLTMTMWKRLPRRESKSPPRATRWSVSRLDPHSPNMLSWKERCHEAGINQASVQFSWEVAPHLMWQGWVSFETITDNTPFTSVNHGRSGCRGRTWPLSLFITLCQIHEFPACHLVSLNS